MSKTLFVNFRDRSRDLGTEGFWAFDVVVAVFLKHLVDAASSHQMVQNEGWLADAIEQWRFNALCGDCGLFLEDSWSDEQVATFNKLAREACQVLSKRENIPAQEIESWQIMDGNDDRCFARGLPFVTTESAIRLGEAIIKLVDGRLPAPPPATWWFFGTEESDLTMGRRGE